MRYDDAREGLGCSDCALTLNDCCSIAGIKVQEKDFVSRGPRDPALTALDEAAQPKKKEISISNTGTWEFVYTDEVRIFIGCERTSPFLPEALAEFFFSYLGTSFFPTRSRSGLSLCIAPEMLLLCVLALFVCLSGRRHSYDLNFTF